MCAERQEARPLGFDTIISQLRHFGKRLAEKAPEAINALDVFAGEIEKTAKVVDQYIKTQRAILANALNELNATKAKLDAIEKLVVEFMKETGV